MNVSLLSLLILLGAGCVTEDSALSTQVVVNEEPKFISIVTQESNYSESPIKFNGVVSSNAQSIVVTAKYGNKTDEYVLEDYEAGDTSFYYGASEVWDNLAQGSNTYTFIAYYNDGTTKTVSKKINYDPSTVIAPPEATSTITTPIKTYTPPTPSFVPSSTSCCKICSTGKACGNSCISRSYTCHKGPGCACDG